MLKKLLIFAVIFTSFNAFASFNVVDSLKIENTQPNYDPTPLMNWTEAKYKTCSKTYLKTVTDIKNSVIFTLESCDDMLELEFYTKSSINVNKTMCKLTVDGETEFFIFEPNHTYLYRYENNFNDYDISHSCHVIISI